MLSQVRTEPRMHGQETLAGNGIDTARAGNSTVVVNGQITNRLCQMV